MTRTETELNMQIALYLEPSCPFTWTTANWLVGTTSAKGVPLTLLPLSLAIVNEGNGDVPAEYAAQQVAGRRVLRAMEAAREIGEESALELYLEAGTRFHEEGDTRFDRLGEAVDAAGLPASVLEAADDPTRDGVLIERIAAAAALLGGDPASPIVSVDEPRRAFWGPILSEVPVPADGEALLASLVQLAPIGQLSQLKLGPR